MLPSIDQLRRLFPHAIPGYLDALAGNPRLLAEHGLNEPLPLCHFLAQCAAETGDFTILEESGNYSAARLREVFPRHFTPGQAAAYARKPQAVLSRAYANRMGNRGEASGDGWKYRGRSYFQTTGRNNYETLSRHLGVDIVANPELLAKEFNFGFKGALLEWSALNLTAITTRLGPTHEAVLAAARGINCGNVNSRIKPNGLQARLDAFDVIWQELGHPDVVPALVIPAADGPDPHEAAAEAVSEAHGKAAAATSWLKRAAAAVLGFLGLDQAAPDTLDGLRKAAEPLLGNLQWLAANRWVAVALLAVGAIAAAWWVERHLVRLLRSVAP